MKRRRYYRRRIIREFYGEAHRIPPNTPGAVAQCSFCEWGRFIAERKRKRGSALSRAAAALRTHARQEHADKFPKFSTAEEIFGEEKLKP